VRKEIRHPEYDGVSGEYDFGLLFLTGSATDAIFPALNDDDAYPAAGATASALG